MNQLHVALIAGHALAGLIALAVGCFVLRPPSPKHMPLFRIYYVALAALTVFLIAVIAVDWMTLTIVQRIVFSGLLALALYTNWRAEQARRSLQRSVPRTRYVDHVGFTLISLFDAFAIVGAIEMGAPTIVVVAAAVFGVVAGVAAIRLAKRRIRPRPPRELSATLRQNR